MEMELDLLSDCKESKGHNVVVAKMFVCSLSSQPVDHEENNKSTGNEVLCTIHYIYVDICKSGSESGPRVYLQRCRNDTEIVMEHPPPRADSSST